MDRWGSGRQAIVRGGTGLACMGRGSAPKPLLSPFLLLSIKLAVTPVLGEGLAGPAMEPAYLSFLLYCHEPALATPPISIRWGKNWLLLHASPPQLLMPPFTHLPLDPPVWGSGCSRTAHCRQSGLWEPWEGSTPVGRQTSQWFGLWPLTWNTLTHMQTPPAAPV